MAPRKKAVASDVSVVPINEPSNPNLKAVVIRNDTAGVARSRVPKDLPRNWYRTAQIAEPILNPKMLAEFLDSSPTHGVCVRKKARMVAGLGLKIVPRFNAREARVYVRKWEDSKPDERGELKLERGKYKEFKAKLEAYEIEKESLQAWLENINDDNTFREIIERGWQDWEAIGSTNWEILRNEDDQPVRMNHIPAHQIRLSKDSERIAVVTGQNVKPVWFKKYGDKRHLNAETGEFRAYKSTPDEKDFDPGDDFGDKEATEILRYISYSSKDPIYGIPIWYSALGDMIGGVESRDFMIKFFTDKAVPMYAVIMEGGQWTDTTIQTIQQFFRHELTGNYHATLALEVPEGGKINFQQISPEPRWLPTLLKYREVVRDTIIGVHGLSPAIVGTVESGNIGAGQGTAQMEMVKTTEIRPRQETLEWFINTFLIKRGLGMNHVMVKFDEIDTEDEAKVQGFVSALYSTPPRPALTTNDARVALRMDTIDAAWADEILVQDPQYGLLPLSQLDRAYREAKKAQAMAAQQGGGMPGAPGGMPGQPAQPQQPLDAATLGNIFSGGQDQPASGDEPVAKSMSDEETTARQLRRISQEIIRKSQYDGRIQS